MPAASSRSIWPAIAAQGRRAPAGRSAPRCQINAQGQAPGFTTHICDVEVDRETGHVKILRYTAIQDVGRAIHPSYVEGQIQGGVAQGIGWALNEEYIYDKDGRLENPGFLDYRVPVASDMPMIEAVMVEVPNPRHPFGARGVGEVPIVPPMAAVANAIADATGMRLRDLPMSPPKLRAALDERSRCAPRRSRYRAATVIARSGSDEAISIRSRDAARDRSRFRSAMQRTEIRIRSESSHDVYATKELQKVVGTRPIRPDGVDKVTGRANFGADMVMPGMLWGKVQAQPARPCPDHVDQHRQGADAARRQGHRDLGRFPADRVGGGLCRRRADELPRPVAQLHGARQGAL